MLPGMQWSPSGIPTWGGNAWYIHDATPSKGQKSFRASVSAFPDALGCRGRICPISPATVCSSKDYSALSFATFNSTARSNLLSLEDFPPGSITPINGSLSLDDLLDERLRSPPAPSPYNGTNEEKIPRIVHRTYKTQAIPSRWSRAWKTCKEFNPSYTHYFWTDETGRDFIRDNFPWFLRTYDNYPYSIQRADVLRYFLLWKYGGIYIDMDISCKRPLDPLLNQSAWLPITWPYGVSNDVMASVPAHPLLIKAALSLFDYNKFYISKYFTVLFTTGPMFLNSILAAWYSVIRDFPGGGKVDVAGAEDLSSTYPVAILPDMFYHATEYTFFRHHKGSTWHGNDAAVVRWLYDHLFTVVFPTLLVLRFAWIKAQSRRRAKAPILFV